MFFIIVDQTGRPQEIRQLADEREAATALLDYATVGRPTWWDRLAFRLTDGVRGFSLRGPYGTLESTKKQAAFLEGLADLREQHR